MLAFLGWQIIGSVWHGAPTANLISGGLFTLALPPLLWLLVLRVRRRRWRRAKGIRRRPDRVSVRDQPWGMSGPERYK